MFMFLFGHPGGTGTPVSLQLVQPIVQPARGWIAKAEDKPFVYIPGAVADAPQAVPGSKDKIGVGVVGVKDAGSGDDF